MSGRTPWWGYVINGGSIGACSMLLLLSESSTARLLALISIGFALLALGLARHRARTTSGTSS